jgi:radical SAM superfamily enzyme YgiQ (UPF0313 family)
VRPLRVALAQFEGATTMRVLPLAAGLLAAVVRRAADLHATTPTIFVARRGPHAVASELAAADVLGLSLYTWNERYSLDVARRAKVLKSDLLVVAGGPSAPRRPEDATAFLRRHPEVDVLVAGEGERVFVEILRAWRRGATLDGLAGVAVRTGDAEGEAIHVTPRGPRMTADDFLATGSPFLDGTFDDVLRSMDRPMQAMVFETNRGCPFSCTFCDWGQATESRVHELPIERVEAELRWAAERRIPYFYIIDANFGIRRRDLDVVRYLGRLRAECGYPQFVYFHLTKNATEKNLATVEALRAAGIGTHVSLSMQDFDPTVLRAIERDNIRPDRALALRARAHGQGLPTTNELLLGLPAQTRASFRASIARALTPYPADSFSLYTARVLVNAEMAEPEYRARWGLITRSVPSEPREPADASFVVEREEVVVGSDAMSISEWRSAFAVGFLLAALANQRLLPTTLHVIQFALGRDCMVWIDALLDADTPRLVAIRAELLRHADAILNEEATSLPVLGFGDTRRDVVEGVVARVLEDVAAFASEAAAVAATAFPDVADLLRDAVAWDALSLPGRFAAAKTERFRWDWLAYVANMGACPCPVPRATTVRCLPHAWVETSSTAAHLDAFLMLGWSKVDRVQLAYFDVNIAAFDDSDPSPPFFTRTAV